jgi:DNA-binding transcriptional regulator YhcF (GntR family)
MVFVLDRSSGKPYPTQVNEQLLAQVVVGRLALGARLPSVRDLARRLHISRTTAHRIHESLQVGGVAELRPRKGAYVVRHPGEDVGRSTEHAQELYGFLNDTLQRAKALGIDPTRLTELLSRVDGEDAHSSAEDRRPSFALLSTADWFECIRRCLGDAFSVKLLHVPPRTPRPYVPAGIRYLLFGYFMYEEARRLADAIGCQPIFVRYNVRLFDKAMSIRPGEHRCFVTHDADNAVSTRNFLASAYPEVDATRYDVWSLRTWLERPDARQDGDQVWATVTAAPYLRDSVDRSRLQLLHPLLANDFVDELRHLALVV